MKSRIISLVLFILIIMGCQPRNASRYHLKQRVNEYYSYLIKGDYDLSWNYLWKEGKRKWSQNEWIDFVRGSEAVRKLTGAETKSISIKGIAGRKIGLVKGVGTYFEVKARKIAKYEDEELWLFENGDWFRFLE